MRALLIGNYGVGNLGDEALREYFLTRFPGIEWTVVTASGKGRGEVPRLPLGLHSLSRSWWRTLATCRQADVVVFGGGSLFTDSESAFACLLWWWHAFWARVLSKPIVLAFQGIGPFRTRIGQRLTRWVVERAAFLSVRDRASLQRVSAWLSQDLNTKIIQSFDPVFSLMEAKKMRNDAKNVIIIPRANSGETFLRAVSDYTRGEPTQSVNIVIQPLEDAIGRAVRQACAGDRERVALTCVRSIRELASEVSEGSLVLTQRYHGAVCALALDVPFRVVPQAAGDKLDEIATMGRDDCERLCREGEEGLKAFFGRVAAASSGSEDDSCVAG